MVSTVAPVNKETAESPSVNAWVSGVAGLFSDEFYRLVRRHLHDDGLLVQWLQLYEIDINLVASVILDYRAFDTLGEATVLLTAAVAVLAVVRRVGKRPSAEEEP